MAASLVKAGKLRARADEILGREGLSPDKFDMAVRLLDKAAAALALADPADAGTQAETGLLAATQARVAAARTTAPLCVPASQERPLSRAPGAAAPDGKASETAAAAAGVAGDAAGLASSSGIGALPTEFDRQYAACVVERKADEEGDRNFPPTLYAACELFARVGAAAQLRACMTCTSAYVRVLHAGPDGKTAQSMGRACVCWLCGHVGLPHNADRCVMEGTAVA